MDQSDTIIDTGTPGVMTRRRTESVLRNPQSVDQLGLARLTEGTMSRPANPNNPTFAGIYAIIHVSSDGKEGNRYIGSSSNIHERWHSHRVLLNQNKHHCRHLQYAWRKYGSKEFRFDVIERTFNEAVILIAREQHWMDKFADKLYNSESIADIGSAEWHRSEAGRAAKNVQKQKTIEWWKTQKPRKRICEICGCEFLSRHTSVEARRCSTRCQQTSLRRSGKLAENRICVMCGKEFTVSQKGHTTKTCSSYCAMRSKSQFSIDDIKSILTRVSKGESMLGIGKEYGVDHGTIRSIGTRQTWADIPIDPEIGTALQKRFATPRQFPDMSRKASIEQIREIKRRLKYKVNQSELAREFGLSRQMICNIKYGRMYADIEPSPD